MTHKGMWMAGIATAMALTTSCVRRVDIEVPDRYEGPVVIVYGAADGEALDSGLIRSVYRVPAGGILRLRAEAPPAVRPRFWYLRSDGSRVRLGDGREDRTSVAVYGFGAVRRKLAAIGFVVSTAEDREKWLRELGKWLHQQTS